MHVVLVSGFAVTWSINESEVVGVCNVHVYVREDIHVHRWRKHVSTSRGQVCPLLKDREREVQRTSWRKDEEGACVHCVRYVHKKRAHVSTSRLNDLHVL